MAQALLFLLISAVLTFALYPLVINFLYRFQLQEETNPEAPETHRAKRGTPTAAGVLLLIVFLILNLAFNHDSLVTPILLISSALGILGLLEDFFKIYYRSRLRRVVRGRVITPIVTLSDLSRNIYKLLLFPWNAFKEVFRALGGTHVGGIATYQKILVQLAIATFLAVWLSFNFGTEVWLPLGATVDLGYFYIPFVIAAFLFFVNSINITDGLDGLAAGLLAINFTAMMAVAVLLGKDSLAVVSAVAIGSLLSFLYFNIYPARVFMGNVGALFLAGVFVSTAFVLGREVLLPVVGGVFVIEGLSDLIQVGSVKLGKGRIFSMAPIHHHFELRGWSETKVTMRFWLAGAFLSFLGFYLALL
jgi:phospho-N-acetylmuramoyl-pentapeptide-transferase